ncbi:MAG: hypothetical protein H6734_09075 [Alphaproteobacteria bacterium]|nr:hypothetical protein [Alphaproteobacteria bacterium]
MSLILALFACVQDVPPVEQPPQAAVDTIGAEGGTLVSEGGSVMVPPGALDADVELTWRSIGPGEISDVWALDPAGLAFAAPVTVTIPLYPDATDVENAAISWTDGVGGRRLDTVVGGLAATALVYGTGIGEAVPRTRISESFEVPGSAVDILLVIDDSGSMAEEQAQLAQLAHGLIERLETRGVDFHIGITTTDTDHAQVAGKLRPLGLGERFLTPQSPDAPDRLASAVLVGTDGSSEETGRAALYQLLQTRAAAPENQGFRRPQAPLEVLFVSDEEDRTLVPSLQEFNQWLRSLEEDSGAPVVIHAVVGLTDVDCDGLGRAGTLYLGYAERTGGTVSDICVGPGTSVGVLGDTARPVTDVQLAFLPEPDSLRVEHSADPGFGRPDVEPLDRPHDWRIHADAPGTVTFSYLPVDPDPFEP